MTTKALTGQELRAYRDRLQALATRLTDGVAVLADEAQRPTGADGVAAEGPAHQAIVTSSEGDAEVARCVLVSEEHTLENVRAALARLDAGTFGRCELCGRAIAKARLDAVPHVGNCIRCARAAEGNAAD